MTRAIQETKLHLLQSDCMSLMRGFRVAHKRSYINVPSRCTCRDNAIEEAILLSTRCISSAVKETAEASQLQIRLVQRRFFFKKNSSSSKLISFTRYHVSHNPCFCGHQQVASCAQ